MNAEVRYRQTLERIAAAAGGRDVRLIAVSKGQPAQAIAELYRAGHRDFGENYAQELAAKAEQLSGECSGIRWHFIGHLQKNKAKHVVRRIHSIHSVNSLGLALELSKRWAAADRQGSLSAFVEVNIDVEPTKTGALPADVIDLCRDVARAPGLDLRGLMCVPSSSSDPADAFSRLRRLEESCRPATHGELSMGMTADFEIALREGATCVRLGTLLFGARGNAVDKPLLSG